MAILTTLILPTQEHGISFHFFDSSLVSFINVLYFSAFKSSTSLVRFVSRYFIFWHDFKRDFFFLLSFSDVSLLVLRSATDFCMLSRVPLLCICKLYEIAWLWLSANGQNVLFNCNDTKPHCIVQDIFKWFTSARHAFIAFSFPSKSQRLQTFVLGSQDLKFTQGICSEYVAAWEWEALITNLF